MREISLEELAQKVSEAKESLWDKAQANGRSVKVYLHWTAGSYYSKFDDYHINIDKFFQDYFKKNIAFIQTAPARVSFAFHSAKSHVPYNYRSRKSCAVAVRRKQKRLCLKTRKRRNWLGLAGVAHPRRMRRSLTSLSHPTETSNKVCAFHFMLVRPLETGVVGHKSYILLFSYSSIFRVQMKFYCF